MTITEIQNLLEKQREYYRTGVTIPTDFRIKQLKKLYAVVKKYVAMYTAEQIVTRAIKDAKKRKDVSKFGFIARFQMLLAKILPHSFVMSYWLNQQKLTKRK